MTFDESGKVVSSTNDTILVCVQVNVAQQLIKGYIDTLYRFNRPACEQKKVLLYCAKKGVRTATTEHGGIVITQGQEKSLTYNGYLVNGRIFGEAYLQQLQFDFERQMWVWRLENITIYDDPHFIYEYRRAGATEPMYKAIGDWCYVEEVETENENSCNKD